DPDEGRGGAEGRAREWVADDFEPGAHGGARAGAGDQVQGDAARRGCGVGDGGDAGCGAETGNDYRRTDGADGEIDLSLRAAAQVEGYGGASDGGDGARQEKCGRSKAVRAAGGDWR